MRAPHRDAGGARGRARGPPTSEGADSRGSGTAWSRRRSRSTRGLRDRVETRELTGSEFVEDLPGPGVTELVARGGLVLGEQPQRVAGDVAAVRQGLEPHDRGV